MAPVTFPETASIAFTSVPFNPEFTFLAVLDLHGRVLHVNDATLLASGTCVNELHGKVFWHTRWFDSAPCQTVWPQRLQRVIMTGKTFHGEDQFLGSDGVPRIATIAVKAQRDGAGAIEYVVVEAQDVTDSRHAGAELRQKEALLTSAQRLAKLGSWSLDVAADRLQWSAETFRIYGVAPDEFAALSLAEFLQYVHPDDRPAFKLVTDQALARPGLFNYQFRFCSPDGQVKVIRGDGEVTVGAHGKAERLVGTVMDVTEQDEMLRAVERSEERMRSLAGTSSAWYWEQDTDARFTLFAGGRYGAGAASGDFIGKSRWEIPGAQPLVGGWDDHRATLRSKKPFTNFEYSAGGPDDLRILSATGEPMHDVQGHFIGYRGTARDVTVAKAAEEKIREGAASLALATRLGRLGAWSVNVSDGAVTWSSEALAIHELDSDAGLSMFQAAQYIDPAWRACAATAIQDCIRTGTPFDIEVQAITARGRPLWIRLIGEAERGPDGTVKRIQGALQDISERKEAAERYRTVSERLTLTLESITDALFTLDRQWRFTYINPEAERIFGVSRGQLLGQVVWERYPVSQGSTFHREYERAMQNRLTARFEAFSEALGRWVQVVAYPSEQGLAVYFRDITESRNVRRALAESEERFRLLFANSVDPIIQTSREGKVLRANPAACAILGSSEAQLQALPPRQLVAPEDARIEELIERRERDGKAMGELTMVRSDGSRFDVEVTTSYYRTSDGELLTTVIFRDITERLQHQQQILLLNAQLGERVRQRTAQLEQANAELKDFAHTLAHDLRAPVAAIKGFGAALHASVDAVGTERDRQHLRRIEAAAQRMNEFIAALLSLATISQAPLIIVKVDLTAMARSILADLTERDTGRALAVSVQDGLVTMGDATLLRMALENLLGNAWKFTGKRAVSKISFGAQQDSLGELVYFVRDNGAGFDMTYAQKLFGSFQRLHRESEFPGTGIGLANVQKIVQRHGGRVWAEAIDDGGATFSFTLHGPQL